MSNHTIHRQVCDLSITEGLDAHQVMGEVEQLLDSVVLPRLEALFDKLSPGPEPLVIDRLELDLQTLSQAQLAQDLEKALLTLVERQLRAAMPASKTVLQAAKFTSLDALLHLLETGRNPWWGNDASPTLPVLVEQMLDTQPKLLAAKLRSSNHPVAVAARLSHQLSESLFFQLLDALEVPHPSFLFPPQEAFLNLLQQLAQRQCMRTTLFHAWRKALLLLALSGPAPRFDLAEVFVQALSVLSSPALLQTSPVLQQLVRHSSLPQEVQRKIIQQLEAPPAPFTQPPLPSPIETSITTPHAGLILIAPWLPPLFAQLSLTLDDAFASEEAQHTALHLLAQMATGGTPVEEHDLLLHKLLCGIEPDAAVPPALELPEALVQEGESLLHSIVEHWPALSSGSPDDLRRLFLQREGLLAQSAGGWQLTVERNGFDILLDQLTWPYGIVRLPWMRETISAQW
jgi:hypothetical protein